VAPVDAALALAGRMIQDGAAILDVGGESTRPGAEDIPAAAELTRTLPLIDALHERWPELPISVDTRKAEVARRALERGAGLVNDISALRYDPRMAEVAAAFECPVVLMHMQGAPATMQKEPRYADVVEEIKRFFEERLAFATRHGIREERLILDPGIGFGKSLEHNLEVLRRLSEFRPLGRPILVGLSRKSFIGKLLGDVSPEERLEGSLAAALWAVQEGASGLRVHDVGPTRRALRLWESIRDIS
jgi:dihydropteroate synthase